MQVAELVEVTDCGVGEGSWLCGLLQVPALLFCSFLMKHPSWPRGFLVWMQRFQPQGRWDSRSSALWWGRFEIRAWNGERGMALSLCSVFWVPTPAAAPDTPTWGKIRWILSSFGPSVTESAKMRQTPAGTAEPRGHFKVEEFIKSWSHWRNSVCTSPVGLFCSDKKGSLTSQNYRNNFF